MSRLNGGFELAASPEKARPRLGPLPRGVGESPADGLKRGTNRVCSGGMARLIPKL